ncbi:MAG TPA: M43 family zinc metalloprotease, partial [Saprospiraceae bacterium]|nr:M43 family zinc metalloprotease [Saprospiraceae bacterium]
MRLFTRLIATLLFYICCVLHVQAQNPDCGADVLLQQKLNADSDFKARHEAMEQQRYQWLKALESSAQQQKGALPSYVIPVVVHIVHQNGAENISDAQVLQGIQHLNAAFANSGYYDNGDGAATPFSFCLARRKPDGTATGGINRVVSPLTEMTVETQDIDLKNLVRWDPTQYVNIWVVKEISSVSVGSGVAGYAYLPSAHGQDFDGIVMEANWFGSSPANTTVLIHEMGHYLGLYHTFEGGCANNDCVQDGDRVCDTPPDQSTAWTPCGTIQNTCTTDANSGFATDQNDMTINYMDYATSSCYNAFTVGQSDRMEYFLLQVRQSLLESEGCLDPCTFPVTAAFTASAGPVVAAGTTVNFTNTSSNAATAEWLVNGATVGTSTNLNYTFTGLGTNIVTLAIKGSDPNCTSFTTDTFTVVCSIQAEFTISNSAPIPGDQVMVTSAGSNTLQYEWTVNGTPFGTGPSAILTLPEPDLYAICLTAANDYCQDISCQYVEAADTVACPKSFLEILKGPNNQSVSFMEMGKLPNGGLVAGGWGFPGWGIMAKISPDGTVEQSWEYKEDPYNAGTITELTPTTDNKIIGLSSDIFAATVKSAFYKFDPEAGQMLWYRQLESAIPFGARLAVEHPVNQNYWIFGMNNPASPGVDVGFVYELNPQNGDLMASHSYPAVDVPYPFASAVIGDQVFTAGNIRQNNNTVNGWYGMACYDPDGSVAWSKRYQWPGVNGFSLGGTFTALQADGEALIAAGGAAGQWTVLLKTDLNGNVIWTKLLQSSAINANLANAEQYGLIVRPDGYVLTSFGLPSSFSQKIEFRLSKFDKQGNYLGTQSILISKPAVGFEVQNDQQFLYGISAEDGNLNEAIFMRLNLEDKLVNLCSVTDKFIFTPVPFNGTTVTALQPQLLPDIGIVFSEPDLTLNPISIQQTVLCEEMICHELCDNGLDDDSDGYVDCYDADDCPCNVVPDCVDSTFSPDLRIAARIDWSSPDSIVNTAATPIVANLDPQRDNIPEIIFTRLPTTGQLGNELLIFHGDGSNAATPAYLPIPAGYAFNPGTTPAVGDVNNDGIPDLVMLCSDRRLHVFTDFDPAANPVMSLLTVSIDSVAAWYSSKPLLADFNQDGRPEIYVGKEVFQFDFSNPATPILRRAASGGAGPSGLHQQDYSTASPVAADLLSIADCAGDPDCEGLEIAAGHVIYSVDLNPFDGDPVQIKPMRNLQILLPFPKYSDGQTTVADVDLDGTLDVVVAGKKSQTFGVYAWNKNGLIQFFPLPVSNIDYAGLVSVANVYDDKLSGAAVDFPELIVGAKNKIFAFNINAANQTPTTPYWWTLPVADDTYHNSMSFFDFNKDGMAEIVARDQDSLRIIYGGPAPFPTGVNPNRNWCAMKALGGTLDEYPVIADVDNDNQAEIVIGGHRQVAPGQHIGSNGQILVFEADPALTAPWLPTRSCWNQFSYFSVNVNDGLRIPETQQPGHLELPAGSGKRPLNMFLGQPPKYDRNFNPYLPLPDASIEADTLVCSGNAFAINLKVCNTGSTKLPAGTPLRLYTGDPTVTTAALLPQMPVVQEDVAPDSCFSFQITLTPPPAAPTIYLVVNDNGSKTPPFDPASDFPVGTISECDYLNNIVSIPLPPAPPSLDLGPDIIVCQNGVWTFDAGPGFQSYQWSTLSADPAITVYAPGTYWVEVRDFCGNPHRDTVTVVVDAATIIELGPDTMLCDNAILQFNVPGFAGYQWFPAGQLSCTGCGNPVAQPSDDVTYTVVAKTALGCYSTDSIRVTVGQAVQLQLDTAICAGATLTMYGEDIPAGSSQVFSFATPAGCDSTLTVTVAVLPVVQTTENQAICAGDSALIFNQWQHEAGVFSQTFTASGGCDSTHTITLAVVPEFQTLENRTICAGDSALIFNQWQHEAGVFS